jgi:hypothetical protein
VGSKHDIGTFGLQGGPETLHGGIVPTITDTAHAGGQPLGSWWAYKRYADITGQLVSVKAGSRVDGVTYLLDSGQVNVLVERIPSGSEVVTTLPVVSNQVLSVIGNAFSLTVDWTNSLDAYSITLTSPQR